MGNYDINVILTFADAVNTQSLNSTIDRVTDAIDRFQKIVSQKTTSTTKGSSTNVFTNFAKDANDATQKIRQARVDIAKEWQKLADMQKKGLSAGSTEVMGTIKNISDLKQKVKELTIQQRDYNAVAGKTTSAMGSLGKGAFSLRSTFGALMGVLGIGGGAFAFFQGIKDAIKTIADFDLAQAKLRSILGDTVKGMQDVRDSAIQVGSASIFGAKGVSELQIELAKMGFTKNEIMAMQEAIVNLATATQEELAPSAEVVANVLRAYNMSASEATHVVDVMGKAFNDSALDLANFREAIKYVAPVAKQANFTFEETVSLMEALSNAGIKGSLAGTGLTNILSRLGNENSKFVKTLGRTVNGFDDFIGALIELKGRGTNLTDVFQLVDRRAAATFSILLQGVRTVQEFKDKLADVNGVMKEQTAVQLDTVTNKTLLLKNAWQAMILQIDSGQGALSTSIKNTFEWLTKLIERLNIVTTTQKEAQSFMNRGLEARGVLSALPATNVTNDAFGKQKVEEKKMYTEKLLQVQQYYAQLTEIEFKYTNKISKIRAELEQHGEDPIKILRIGMLQKALQKSVEELKAKYGDMEGVLANTSNDIINAVASTHVETFKNAIKTTKDIGKLYDDTIEQLLSKQMKFDPGTMWFNVYAKALDQIDVVYKKAAKINQGVAADKTAAKNLLEQEKQIALERVKLAYDGEVQKRKLIETTFYYDMRIAKETMDAGEEQNNQLKLVNLKYLNDLKVIKFANLKEQLEAEKAHNNEVIKITMTGFEQERALLISNYEADRKIAEVEDAGSLDRLKNHLRQIQDTYESGLATLREKIVDAITKINDKNVDIWLKLNVKDAETPVEELHAMEDEFFKAYIDSVTALDEEYAKLAKVQKEGLTIEQEKEEVERKQLALNIMLKQVDIERNKLIKDAVKEVAKINEENDKIIAKSKVKLAVTPPEIIDEKQQQNLEKYTQDIKIINEQYDLIAGSKIEGLTIEEEKAKQYALEHAWLAKIAADEQAVRDVNKQILDDFDKWAIKNPFMNFMMGKQVKADLLSGVLSKDKLDGMTDMFDKSMGQIKSSIEGIADAWVQATDKILSNYDRLISETQNQLQIELQLNQQGFASNVTYEQKKLDNLFESRKKAAEDYKKAVQAQMALDSAATVVSLSLAWADYIKNYAKYPFVGVALAAASIASAFAMFQKFQASAKEAATRYEEGGLLTGKRHSQGGIKIKELNAEVEGGEYVINRKSTIKYRPLIEAINKDDKVSLNKVYLSGMTKSAVKVNVNLDESKELVAIRKLLQGSGITVEYRGNYRIERTGNVERRIRLN